MDASKYRVMLDSLTIHAGETVTITVASEAGATELRLDPLEAEGAFYALDDLIHSHEVSDV